jgi:hypothetical protein
LVILEEYGATTGGENVAAAVFSYLDIDELQI